MGMIGATGTTGRCTKAITAAPRGAVSCPLVNDSMSPCGSVSCPLVNDSMSPRSALLLRDLDSMVVAKDKGGGSPHAGAGASASGRRRSARQAPVQLTKQEVMRKIEQLIANDLTEYNYAVPTERRLSGATKMWHSLARHFATEVEPILKQRDEDRYQANLQLYNCLPMHKRLAMPKPTLVLRPRMPLFCLPLMVAGPCYDMLMEWIIKLRQIKRQAAKECILASTEYDYTIVRDKMYMALLMSYAGEQVTRQKVRLSKHLSKFSMATELPQTAKLVLSQGWEEVLIESFDALLSSRREESSFASISTESKLQSLPKGDAFIALVPKYFWPKYPQYST